MKIQLQVVFTTQSGLEVGLSGMQTKDHSIPFRYSNILSWWAMSSTLTQGQLCAATQVLHSVQDSDFQKQSPKGVL